MNPPLRARFGRRSRTIGSRRRVGCFGNWWLHRNGWNRFRIVALISSPGNGGGGNGWVTLTKHDADGAAGLGTEPMSRWYGGMVHEMGHMFTLPDSSSTDGTPMSASFYSCPN